MIDRKSLGIAISESSIIIGEVRFNGSKYVCDVFKSYPVNNWASADDIVQTWATAMRDFMGAETFPIKTLHIAIPGPFDYEAGVSYIKENRNLKSLYGRNIKEMLAAQLKIAESSIFLYNDAVSSLAAAYPENQPVDDVILGLYFGEGFGSAICLDGKIRDAALWDKPFAGGKAEDFFSVKWLRKNYFEATGLNIVEIEEINFISSTGKELLKAFLDHLAQYIKHLLEAQRIETIVLGGELLESSAQILPLLKRRLSALAVSVQLIKSKVGALAPLLGTSVLRDEYREVKGIKS